MKNNVYGISQKVLALFLVLVSASVYSADRKLMELRTCMASEFALIVLDHADKSKSYEENLKIGKRFGYVIGDIYKEAIWSMDDPESAAIDIMTFAMESGQSRAELMPRSSLKRDVDRCRAKFR